MNASLSSPFKYLRSFPAYQETIMLTIITVLNFPLGSTWIWFYGVYMWSALYGHYDLFTPKLFNKLKFSTILAKIMHAKPSDGDVEVWDTQAKAANQ